jgi:glucan biosynthesis protein
VDQIPKTEGKVKVVRTAGGRKLSTDKNEIVIDYSHINANDISHIRVDASISSGAILESRIESNPSVDGARVFITFDPQDAEVAELRVQLSNKDKPLGMTWLYRFTAEDWPL